MSLEPENEAPPTVEHAFEPSGEWWSLCRHCNLAMPAHLTLAEEPAERVSHAEGAFARAFAAEMRGAQEQELRAAAQQALQLLELLVRHGRAVPDYQSAVEVRERLRNALTP